MEITKNQIKLIHTLKTKAALDDDLYRDILSRYRVESSKELDTAHATALIRDLGRLAEARKRLESATPRQRRLLLALWYQVSRAEDYDTKKKAFDAFLGKRFSIEGINALKRSDVEKVVKALEAMGASRERFQEQ